MEIIKVENLSFTYPNRENKALENINMSVNKGEFVTVCGKSGCGKTTLLRLMKSAISPVGDISGSIFFDGKILSDIDSKEQAAKIGFVMQSCDNQIVTDKVWHELAFGLESLGYCTSEIRIRVSEIASFFGIEQWFYKNVSELSGGQKQLLNLASVMVMGPSVLILDEPTSQLDPIAAGEFLKVLEKINRELGVAVILSEHRLEEALSVCDRVIVMDNGKIIADGKVQQVGEILKAQNHEMRYALPTPMRVYAAIDNNLSCPITVRDGRAWLEEYTKIVPVNSALIPKTENEDATGEMVIEIKDAWFRYEKDLPDVIKGLNVEIKKGELFSIVGGNGTGKTTALSLICALNTPYRGDVFINGKSISKIHNLYGEILGVLPQNPQSIFVKKTVRLDLLEVLSETKLSENEKESYIKNMAELCRIDNLLDYHPYDLSGGEQQRCALAKVLLMSPQILLLDEPTKGLDAYFKQIFADIINDLKQRGITIVMVSHDIEFCAEFADRCAMFFDGSIVSCGAPREFFCEKNFYTTSANTMARTTIPKAVLADDIILALGGEVEKREIHKFPAIIKSENTKDESNKEKKQKLSFARIATGSLFALLFALTLLPLIADINILNINAAKLMSLGIYQIIMIIELFGCCVCFFPQKEVYIETIRQPEKDRKLTKRTIVASLLILLAIPLTIYIGIKFLDGRKYYFISLLIILETMIPFLMVFEKRRPQAREIVIISVLCAIAVAGRAAFFMLPQFKPVVAIAIIAGVCFGGETGFLVGAGTGLVSNFFFGQGPWAPWQMFAFGIIGFIAGVLFKKGFLRKTKESLCIFGFASTLVVYGGIMNLSSVIMAQNVITKDMIISAYLMGLPFDMIHALSSAFFLCFIAEPMVEKLERIKIKYGMLEG